ncbi:hypothetical protein HWV23_16250 [Natronomonas halophila]|uniref:polysaccharide deacetylase family protein n=1 Tax=Natronomonas halophila TaxID=2747817 RepID=UPI0015B52D1E|nr:polysaccharide deacetylase family protein [Natronomonas halophila]QLD87207.1 hypothetical protein HWV23_16250 [Natronomonas halophila]
MDRIYKTYQYVWNAAQGLDLRELAGVLSSKNPYWTFDRIMDIEASLGVRSSFNVLDEMRLSERPKSEWLTKTGWKLFAGRYDIDDPDVAATLRVLDAFGWEIGLHGSYTSSENPERFEYEKDRIESVVDTEIIGNRQHYWNLSRPETWRHLSKAGIKYDTSLGSSTDIDFQHGYDLVRPFDDEFVVFPWSLMDGAVMNSGETTEEILANCRDVLAAARHHRSVLVLDWHAGDVFSDTDYPGWGDVYERVIEEALDMGAWVGPPGEFYEAVSHPDGTVEGALESLAQREKPASGAEVPAVSEGGVTDD